MVLSRARNSLLALIFGWASVASAVCLSNDDYSTNVCADSPTEYLRLGEVGNISSSIAADASGNNHTANYQVNLNTGLLGGQVGIAGACGNSAVAFNPVSDSGQLARLLMCGGGGTSPSCTSSVSTWLSPIASGTWSLEFWLKWTIPPSVHGATESLFQKLNTNIPDLEWQVVSGTSDKLSMVIFQESLGFTVYQQINTATALTGTTDYYHVVWTWDTASTTGTIYVNGASDATSSTVAGVPANDAEIFWMMVRQNNALNDAPGFAVMDEVAFYPSVLSGARVTAHYNVGVAACVGGEDWPYLVRAPCLPKFRSDGYFDRIAKAGFNTGHFLARARQPQFLNVGYMPTFPRGDFR